MPNNPYRTKRRIRSGVPLTFADGDGNFAKPELSVTEFTKIPVSGDVVSIPVQVVNSNISVFAPEETENDVDGNGVVNALDLMYLKKAIIDSANVSEDVLKRADINKNGELKCLQKQDLNAPIAVR